MSPPSRPLSSAQVSTVPAAKITTVAPSASSSRASSRPCLSSTVKSLDNSSRIIREPPSTPHSGCEGIRSCFGGASEAAVLTRPSDRDRDPQHGPLTRGRWNRESRTRQWRPEVEATFLWCSWGPSSPDTRAALTPKRGWHAPYWKRRCWGRLRERGYPHTTCSIVGARLAAS
jgi:hypothetical protein